MPCEVPEDAGLGAADGDLAGAGAANVDAPGDDAAGDDAAWDGAAEDGAAAELAGGADEDAACVADSDTAFDWGATDGEDEAAGAEAEGAG